jgi:hypothetical protein
MKKRYEVLKEFFDENKFEQCVASREYKKHDKQNYYDLRNEHLLEYKSLKSVDYDRRQILRIRTAEWASFAIRISIEGIEKLMVLFPEEKTRYGKILREYARDRAVNALRNI